jgi:hypothetical protein
MSSGSEINHAVFFSGVVSAGAEAAGTLYPPEKVFLNL